MFIVLEGIDGSGSTTHVKLLADRIKLEGVEVVTTNEPTDSPIGKLIRDIFTGETELKDLPAWEVMTALFTADRVHHINTKIQPALDAGKIVISDRYYFSTLAYQTASGGDPGKILLMQELLNVLQPDLAMVLDLPVEIAHQRRAKRKADKYEEDLAYQQEVSNAYFQLAVDDPNIQLIDASRDIEVVADSIFEQVEQAIYIQQRKASVPHGG